MMQDKYKPITGDKRLNFYGDHFLYGVPCNPVYPVLQGCSLQIPTNEYVYVYVVNNFIEFRLQTAAGPVCDWICSLNFLLKFADKKSIKSYSSKQWLRSFNLSRINANEYIFFKLYFKSIDLTGIYVQYFDLFSSRSKQLPNNCRVYRFKLINKSLLVKYLISDINRTTGSRLKLLPRFLNVKKSYLYHIYDGWYYLLLLIESYISSRENTGILYLLITLSILLIIFLLGLSSNLIISLLFTLL